MVLFKGLPKIRDSDIREGNNWGQDHFTTMQSIEMSVIVYETSYRVIGYF